MTALRDNDAEITRDRLGIKQFFYADVDGELIYADDIKEVVTHYEAKSGHKPKLNQNMLVKYLFYGYPIGNETFYEGIYKLPAGCSLKWDKNARDTRHTNASDADRVKIHRYFKPEFSPDYSKCIDDWVEEINGVLGEIFAEECRGDEFRNSANECDRDKFRDTSAQRSIDNSEAFLSGGVDSALLLKLIGVPRAASIGFENEKYDESALARQTAKLLGRDISVKTITPQEYFNSIKKVIEVSGQPLGDASAPAFLLGCESACERIGSDGIIYSGEGVDEFFAGYYSYMYSLQPDEDCYYTCSGTMPLDVVQALLSGINSLSSSDIRDIIDEPVRPLWQETEGLDEISRKQIMDISLWLDGDIYYNIDRVGDYFGLQFRMPFSDVRLLDVASRIPSKYKIYDGYNKYAFRQAASLHLPEEIAFRRKVGFAAPVRMWMADDRYNRQVYDALFSDMSMEFFNRDVLQKLWDGCLQCDEAAWKWVYYIYTFLIWYQGYE